MVPVRRELPVSADAVDFRLHILHGELVFRYQVHFVLQTMNKHTGWLFNTSVHQC